MSETGKNIVMGFRELRRFCNQLALLFKTADGFMEQCGWTPIPRTSVVGNGSGAVDASHWWLPYDFSRFYMHSSFPHILPYIAAIVDNLPDAGPKVITESLLSAGWLDYGAGKEYKGWPYSFCRAHVRWKEWDDCGTMHSSHDPQRIGLPADVVKVSTFAYPLDEINTPEILNEKVVQPLLNEINTRT